MEKYVGAKQKSTGKSNSAAGVLPSLSNKLKLALNIFNALSSSICFMRSCLFKDCCGEWCIDTFRYPQRRLQTGALRHFKYFFLYSTPSLHSCAIITLIPLSSSHLKVLSHPLQLVHGFEIWAQMLKLHTETIQLVPVFGLSFHDWFCSFDDFIWFCWLRFTYVHLSYHHGFHGFHMFTLRLYASSLLCFSSPFRYSIPNHARKRKGWLTSIRQTARNAKAILEPWNHQLKRIHSKKEGNNKTRLQSPLFYSLKMSFHVFSLSHS